MTYCEYAKFGLSIASAALAFVAAYYWLKSARVKTPTRIDDYDGGDFAAGYVNNDGANQLLRSIIEQSKLSAMGAKFAAASAVFQGLSLFL